MPKSLQKAKEVKKAEPKVYEYREKFKSRTLEFKDLPKTKPNPVDEGPDELEGGNWVGEGVERLF